MGTRDAELHGTVWWTCWFYLLGAARHFRLDFPGDPGHGEGSSVKKGAWGELADSTVGCEIRAILVRAFNPNSVFWVWSTFLADTLTANVLQDSWKGPWGLPDCGCFFKHAATIPYVVSSRNTLVSIFSDVQWKNCTRVSKYYHMVHDLILLLMSSCIKYLLKASDDDVLILIWETSSPIIPWFFSSSKIKFGTPPWNLFLVRLLDTSVGESSMDVGVKALGFNPLGRVTPCLDARPGEESGTLKVQMQGVLCTRERTASQVDVFHGGWLGCGSETWAIY